MRGTEERSCSPAGSSALTSQGAQETDEYQAGDTGICEIRGAVHNAFIRFDSRNIRWHVELMFKRLKTLAQIGHLP
jgi:hypothetical protein